MRKLIWYLRTAFCNHEWKTEEIPYEKYDYNNELLSVSIRVSSTCEKCGWHRKYSKF